jgi:hypothetical protein
MKKFLLSFILLPSLLLCKENFEHKRQLRIETEIWEIKQCIECIQDKLTDVEYFDLMLHIFLLEGLVALD